MKKINSTFYKRFQLYSPPKLFNKINNFVKKKTEKIDQNEENEKIKENL